MELTFLYLIIYVICAYNVSFWLVFGEGPFGIFQKFRDFVEKVSPQMRKALNCMNCTPTWVGMIASILNLIIQRIGEKVIPQSGESRILQFGENRRNFVYLFFYLL